MSTKKTILVVEDNSMVVALLKMVLERDGFKVLVAEDGNLAQMAITTEAIDLLIIDIMLPYKSGLEVIAANRPVLDGVPIIVLSALGQVNETLVQVHNLGVTEIVAKPFMVTEIIEKVAVLLPDYPKAG